jgi:hypothetical protein
MNCHHAILASSFVIIAVATGCGKTSSSDGPGAAPSSAATTTTKAAATASEAPKAAVLPPGRTAAPTLAEWTTQKKEVTVKGSSALKCETKMVREYLRISCHDKNDTGGTPTNVQVTKGGREALTFSAGGVTSLIIPYVEGTHLEATFSWTDKGYPLTIEWPKGAKMPTVLGAFAGARSPLDGTAQGDSQKLCDCHKKVTGSKSCEDVFGEANADCDRTYGNDCQMLLACARGEPGAAPHCLPGFLNGIPTGQCMKICKASSDCPKGHSCAADVIPSQHVCVED